MHSDTYSHLPQFTQVHDPLNQDDQKRIIVHRIFPLHVLSPSLPAADRRV